MTNKELSYTGEIGHFPEEVVEWMLQQQELQGNKRNVGVFESNKRAARAQGGFAWAATTCDNHIYYQMFVENNFKPFFEKFPKQQKPAEPKAYKIPESSWDTLVGAVHNLDFKPKVKSQTRIVIEIEGVSHSITDFGIIMTTDRFAVMLNDLLVSSTAFDKVTLFNAVIDELEASLEILEN